MPELAFLSLRRSDPRLWQILSLLGLLAYGTAFLGFDVTPARAGLIVATALLVQLAGTLAAGLSFFDPWSALISSLSLCLLLRTNAPLVAVFAAAAAIGSKFLLRFHGKHLFNPTNFALVLAIALTGDAWVSPGQWGSVAFFGFLLVCAGRLRRPSRGAGRRHADVPGDHARARRGPVAPAPRAAVDPAPSPRERRPSPLRLLHDLGSEDDTGLTHGARRLRGARGGRRRVRSVPPVPSQRSPLVPRPLLPVRPAVRSRLARSKRAALFLRSRRISATFERNLPCACADPPSRPSPSRSASAPRFCAPIRRAPSAASTSRRRTRNCLTAPRRSRSSATGTTPS